MNKEQLVALGLTEEQADAVIKGYGIMIPKSRLDEKIEELKDANDTIKQRDMQIVKLGKDAEGNAELQATITKLTEDNQKAADEYAASLHKVHFGNALEKAYTTAKVKNIKSLTGHIDLDKVKLEGEALTGLDEQLKALKETDAYLFEEEDKQNDPEPPAPKPRFSGGQGHGQNDPVDAFAAKLAKYKK